MLWKGSTGRMLNLMLYPSCPLFHNQSTITKLAAAKKKRKKAFMRAKTPPKKKRRKVPRLKKICNPWIFRCIQFESQAPHSILYGKSRGVGPAVDWRPQQISPFGLNAGNGTTSCYLSLAMRNERFLRKTKFSFYLGSFPLFLHFFLPSRK